MFNAHTLGVRIIGQGILKSAKNVQCICKSNVCTNKEK